MVQFFTADCDDRTMMRKASYLFPIYFFLSLLFSLANNFNLVDYVMTIWWVLKEKVENRPYSYPQYWTGGNFQWRLMWENANNF